MLLACSKERATYKKLSGLWKITRYQYTNPQGLSYYPEVSGSLFIEDCDQHPCAYVLDITFVHPNVHGNRAESGEIQLNETGDHFSLLPSDPTIADTDNQIILLTKDQVKIQYFDGLGQSHHYIFKR